MTRAGFSKFKISANNWQQPSQPLKNKLNNHVNILLINFKKLSLMSMIRPRNFSKLLWRQSYELQPQTHRRSRKGFSWHTTAYKNSTFVTKKQKNLDSLWKLPSWSPNMNINSFMRYSNGKNNPGSSTTLLQNHIQNGSKTA